MNRKRVVMAAWLFLSAAVPAGAQDPREEAPPEVSAGLTADVLSHYVWRGIRLSDGLVVQPSVGVEGHGFSVNLWWNVAGTAPDSTPAPGG